MVNTEAGDSLDEYASEEIRLKRYLEKIELSHKPDPFGEMESSAVEGLQRALKRQKKDSPPTR
jgi:hypothetical protein